MTPESTNDSSWDRVAAELRACREAQQRAWGDIDNTTLGRFLAGEVTPDEHHQIENALDTLPELRKLTDLVRDVLGESEAALPPPSPASIPATLSFPHPQSKTLLPAPEPATTPVEAWRAGKRGANASRFRHYALLAAAACVLLTLGVALPRTSPLPNSEIGSSVAFYHPMAEQRTPWDADRTVAKVDAANEAIAREYISNWKRQARIYQEQGDVARAEPALAQARLLCAKTLGPDAPETVRTRKSLTGIYVAALNAPTLGLPMRRSETPLLRNLSQETTKKKGMADRQSEMPKVMAMLSAPAAAVSSSPPAPLLHSASGYGAPNRSRPMASMPAPNPSLGAKLRYDARTAQRSTAELRQRITRQKQDEVRTCVVPVLVQGLREANDSTERQRLAQALGQLGPAAGDAVPTLIDAYRRSQDHGERLVLLSVLGQIGPSARLAAPLLVEVLRSDAPDLRRAAARALVRLGPAAHGCCKELARQTNRDPLVVEVLQRIDGPEGRSSIDDNAGCFSVESIQQARDTVLQLAKTARLSVRIETFADVVALKQKRDAQQSEVQSNGVCVCIEKKPAAVQVLVSEELRKQGLSELTLREAMEPYLHHRDFDAALRAVLRSLEDFEKKPTGK